MSDISRRWIVAYLIVSVVFGTVGALDDPLRKWLGVETTETASRVTAVYIIIKAIAVACCNTLYGWLIGRVLRLIVPALPWRQWIAAHVAIGPLYGFGVDTLWSESVVKLTEKEGPLVAALALVIIPGIAGAATASVQAFVLRHTTEGLRSWIVVSFLATVCMYLFVVPIWILWPSGTIAHDVTFHGAAFVGGMAEAFVMLLALHRLRPRTA